MSGPRGKWRSLGKDFSREEKLAEIEREIITRKRVFKLEVERGRMREEDGIRRLDIMRAIARDYKQRETST